MTGMGYLILLNVYFHIRFAVDGKIRNNKEVSLTNTNMQTSR